jgi:formylglycine-generating enzyme required for sulfatase activity
MAFLQYGLTGVADTEQGNRDGQVSLLELYKYTYEGTSQFVSKKHGTLQTPSLHGDIAGDFVLGVRRTVITNTLGMKLTLIPAGTFMMGAPESESVLGYDEHQHQVTISKAFYMQTTEVTQGQWKAVMGTEPWKGNPLAKEGPNYPATFVTWNDAVAYCKKLSEKEGKTYRLPTEAEWEYACRAGTKTAWSFGDDANAVGDFAWHDKNASRIRAHYPHHVGLKKPNAFGLFDMHGNVREFCNDYYAGNYYTQSPETDPAGPTAVSFRVIRGGCFGDPVPHLRSANRHPDDFVDNFGIIGFRVVREKD